MDDLISRQAAIDGADVIIARDTSGNNDVVKAMTAWKSYVEALPSVQPEQKKGKWNERKVFDTEDSDIAEMQSAKCSACGKYHTTPYLYFFDNFNFCPNCGADMRGEE